MADDLITVESYRSLPEAEAARLRLEAEGITAVLTDVEIVNMDWLLGNAVGQIKLQVPPGEAERSAGLLAEMRARLREKEQEPEASDAGACLACGAAMPDEESACPACGWSYEGEGSD